MLEFQKGNKPAFETLMHKFYPRVLNFIYRFVGSREVAEDLTQEVFIRVYKTAASYRPQAKFQTWLFTIAKNLSLNELRRRKWKMFSIDATLDLPHGEIKRQLEDSAAINSKNEMERQELVEQVKAAINELPENQRLAVILRRYEDFSYEEIAATMGTSVKAVKSLLNRAKSQLYSKLLNVIKLDN